MNNNDLRVKRTRKLLMGALMESITAKPIEKITVIDICETAMVNRATFYAHFEDKYDLLNACIEDFFTPFVNEDIPEHTIEGFENYYIKVVGKILAHVEDNINIYRALVKKNNSLRDIMSTFIEERLTEKCHMLEQTGVVLPIPAEVISSFYTGAMTNVVTNWILAKKMPPAKEVAHQLGILVHGIN